MEDSLDIEEKYSSLWGSVTLLLGLSTVILFTGYLYIDEILWKGILRVSAFITFSATVISSLKLREGKHQIKLEIEDSTLKLFFFRKGKCIREDHFDLTNIKKVELTTLPSTVFTNEFLLNDYNLKVHLQDSDRPLNLFELDGRILSVNQQTAQEALLFIGMHAPHIENEIDI